LHACRTKGAYGVWVLRERCLRDPDYHEATIASEARLHTRTRFRKKLLGTETRIALNVNKKFMASNVICDSCAIYARVEDRVTGEQPKWLPLVFMNLGIQYGVVL